MTSELRGHRPHVLVIGDMMLDHYLWGGTERISPEAPVQIVDIQRESTLLGGAGNVVNNLIALGAQVSVASVVGDDDSGKELAIKLKSIGVKTDALIVQSGRKSSKKSRVIASGQQILRYDKESKNSISKQSEDKIFSQLEKLIFSYETIIISDYGKGVITPTLSQGVINLANEKNIKVLVDPKGSDYSKYSGAYLLTPNKKEAINATSIDIADDSTLERALIWLKENVSLEKSMITLSEEGIGFYEDKMYKIETVAQEVYDVTGAGDTVISALAYALSAQKSLMEAAKFANSAAAVVVAKIGSATASLDEIELYESSINKSSSDSHIKSHKEIERIAKHARKSGKRIVFTNGCFDILHVGHVKYLERAKSFGDMLIVGLNSDESVKRLKGESRPVNEWEDRAYILASLEAVDYVVGFEDDTPYELIRAVMPDILVKGGDYKGKEVVGSDIASEVRLVDFVDGKSTTGTIERIQEGSSC